MIADLSRAGKRLMGFCRTNLFKRLESSGQAFLHRWSGTSSATSSSCTPSRTAPLPIGTQDAGLLDSRER